ncbi:MAG: MFS transporter [Acidimicrobiia bacterium]|nr:MFS transporter [Acidimicrobiia bacterium]
MRPTTDDPAVDAGHPRRWLILLVLCTSLAVVIIGNSSLNIALPALAEGLKASNSQLQWIVDSYALVFAGMLFTAGTLGDRFGRKGALQIGLVVFLAGALAAATADSAGAVVACRAVMGLGAAFVMPSTLSILVNVFPVAERPKAIAVWAAIAGAGGALGPVGSGFLLEHYSWSSVFLVNVPVVLLALVAGAALVPTSRDPGRPRVDAVGAVLSVVGLVALVYAIIEAPSHGWSSRETLGTAGGALVVLTLFVLWERRRPEPMLDIGYFRDSRFSVGSAGMMLTFFALFGLMFLLTQYLQLVLGYSALATSLRMLPMVLVMVTVSPLAPRLVRWFGANRVVGAGMLVVAAGAIGMSRLTVDTPFVTVLAVMMVMVAGMATAMPSLTNAIMSGVPRAKAGAGSAMNDTTRELGGALGVAVMGSLVTSQFSRGMRPVLAGLPDAAASAAESSLAGALRVASAAGPAGADLAATARSAFVDGMSLAFLAGAVVIGVAATLVIRLLPREVEAVEHGAVPAVPAPVEADGLELAVE